MLDPIQALDQVLLACQPLPREKVPLAKALGRVLARPALAASDYPRFDVSAMDGYALRVGELGKGGIKVAGRVAAGDPPPRLRKGEAWTIMTGAPVPPGADTVIPKEFAQFSSGALAFREVPAKGAHIRRRGEEIRRGAEAAPLGTRLDSRWIGYLSALGVETVWAARRPRVGLLVSGSELKDPGQDLGKGEIYDANGPLLRGLFAERGFTAHPSLRIQDDPDLLAGALSAGLASCDLLLLSGGVSVGDLDHSRPVLRRLGVRTLFWGVAQKPGFPLFVGKKAGCLVFGLPGNPASALTCFHEYVAPALAALEGQDSPMPRGLRARLEGPVQGLGNKTWYMKARAEFKRGEIWAALLGGQGSHMLGSLARGNALAVVPPKARLRRGDWVEIHPLEEGSLA